MIVGLGGYWKGIGPEYLNMILYLNAPEYHIVFYSRMHSTYQTKIIKKKKHFYIQVTRIIKH